MDPFSLNNTSNLEDEEDPSSINPLSRSLEKCSNKADPVWEDFLVNGFLILPLFSLLSVLLLLGVVREVTVRTASEISAHTLQI